MYFVQSFVVRPKNMEVHSESFEDIGEKDEQGLYDYYYSGTLFSFRDSKSGYLVRQYADSPSEAHFLSGLAGTKRTGLPSIPYDDELFC